MRAARPNQLAAQRLRDDIAALRQELEAGYRARYNVPQRAAADLAKVKRLLLRARPLADRRFPRQLEEAASGYQRAAKAVRARSYDASLQSSYALNALRRVILRPAFGEGERLVGTRPGVVEAVREYSESSGWLYGIRDPRGVFDNAWESHIVWAKMNPGRSASRSRARRRA